MTAKIQYAGMVWYRRKDYKKLLSIFSDSHLLPKSFDKWLERAEEGFNFHTAQGTTVEKVYIDPQTFVAWCQARGLNVDAEARVAFSNDFVARKYLGKNV